MKKVLALMLALVLVLSLVACGGSSGNSNSNEIDITIDNYSKYLKIDTQVCEPFADVASELGVGSLNGGKGLQTNDGWVGTVYNTMELYIIVSGLSQNFNYNNIKMTGTLKGSYKTYESKEGTMHEAGYIYGFYGSETFNKEITLECDITGQAQFADKLNLSNDLYTASEVVDCNFEVTSISGSVTPA